MEEHEVDFDIQTECKYHLLLSTLYERISARLESYYDWEMFNYWIGDESAFASRYRETFVVIFAIFHEGLTPEQLENIEKKGRNLEEQIPKWLQKWRTAHPNLPNEKMPFSCLKNKIYEYIIYQFRQRDLKELIGNPC
jgi:hypothetical protein